MWRRKWRLEVGQALLRERMAARKIHSWMLILGWTIVKGSLLSHLSWIVFISTNHCWRSFDANQRWHVAQLQEDYEFDLAPCGFHVKCAREFTYWKSTMCLAVGWHGNNCYLRIRKFHSAIPQKWPTPKAIIPTMMQGNNCRHSQEPTWPSPYFTLYLSDAARFWDTSGRD